MGYFFAIFFGTLVLEDVALASSLALIAQNKMGFETAFAACFFGIALGDLGVYGLGYLLFRLSPKTSRRWLSRWHDRIESVRGSTTLPSAIVVSRAVPGTRLPTYLAAGYLRYPFWRFLLLTAVSVLAWVGLTLGGGHSIVSLFSGHWIIILCIVVILFKSLRALVPKVFDRWDRRALRHSWRKWTHFEFWPAWLFYLPIVPYYAYKSLRQGSFLLPFYVNPEILNGGLIGESKWDFLRFLDHQDPATLTSLLVGQNLSVTAAIDAVADFATPFILKPDVGQRGYGVRIVRSRQEILHYLKSSAGTDVIAQRRSELPREAGILYYRIPGETKGVIFSITDKEFPFLIGDGERAFGSLILADARARILAPVYFARHRAQLDRVFAKGERIVLAECGNHCQGAIFKNGWNLNGPGLARRLDEIAGRIPHFHFGRFDVRYLNAERLQAGLDFEIVEINGAGSEATHIWDSRTRLVEAYRVLFAQWDILFQIGGKIRAQKNVRANIWKWRFLAECLRVLRRRNDLSVSS